MVLQWPHSVKIYADCGKKSLAFLRYTSASNNILSWMSWIRLTRCFHESLPSIKPHVIETEIVGYTPNQYFALCMCMKYRNVRNYNDCRRWETFQLFSALIMVEHCFKLQLIRLVQKYNIYFDVHGTMRTVCKKETLELILGIPVNQPRKHEHIMNMKQIVDSLIKRWMLLLH